MTDAERLAAQQLARMRGMTALYHRRFFQGMQLQALLILALGATGFGIARELFLAVPFVALYGANQAGFDASYLIFARQYAARLERRLNASLGERLLVGAELESAYLFPLDARKIVTLRLGSGFTWFGFMTAFYTLLGVLAYLFALALGLGALHGGGRLAYLAVLLALTALSLLVGLWWFVGGEGERRLRRVLDAAFGKEP